MDLYRKFNGDGHFIPLNLNDTLDRLAIKTYMDEFGYKKTWIRRKIRQLSRLKSFKKIYQLMDSIDQEMKVYLIAKSRLNSSVKGPKKSFKKIKKYYSELLTEISFLRSYKSPVDFFGLRKEYDQFKGASDKKMKRKANQVYFLRKLMEDGAQDPDHSRNDRFLRANIDSLALRFRRTDYLSEDMRYDLVDALEGISYQLKRGKKVLISRLREWDKRNWRAYKFYGHLLKGKKEASLVREKVSARYRLKEFVYNKLAETYLFWRKAPPRLRALYALETILFSEVGGLDLKEGVERRDVSQVVLNRTKNYFYRQFGQKDALYQKLLQKLKKKEIQQYYWLNTLFKEGEFSFTYYFIPGSRHIFCADQSGRAKKLRQDNVDIALDTLKAPRWSFKGLRYFSRASMLGRIEMSSLWTDYSSLPERPGPILKLSPKQKEWLKKGEYIELYRFLDNHRRSYRVMRHETGDMAVQRLGGSKKYYSYRNPHFFRYFSVRQ